MTEVMMEKERSEATLAVPDEFDAVDEQLVEQLTDRARSQGLELTGEGGLLARLTKRVVDSALEGELDDHLGYASTTRAAATAATHATAPDPRRVLTEAGPVSLDVPRDRAGSFSPQLIKKRQRRLSGLDELVISLSAAVVDTATPRCRHTESRPPRRSPPLDPAAGSLRRTRSSATCRGGVSRVGLGSPPALSRSSRHLPRHTQAQPPQGRIAAPHGVLGARVFTVGGEHCG